jgi:hypothetical protein
MAGRGPAPKPADKRARRNTDPVPLRVLIAEALEQPALPGGVPVSVDGELVELDWPERTRDWWQMWNDSPLSAEFTSTDWSFLLDTAMLHAAFWRGDIKVAGELRQRVAKFGATPEDRARLRITFAAADEAEEKPARQGSARERYKGLRAVERDGVAGS